MQAFSIIFFISHTANLMTQPHTTRTRIMPVGILLSTFLLPALPFYVSAQISAPNNPPPIPVSGAAYARTATKLYVSGGNNSRKICPQFYSLDLAIPWSSSQPAWTVLADGPTQQLFPAVFSADQQTMITFHSGSTSAFAMRYSVAKNTWSRSSIEPIYGVYQGVGAVTDPSTNLVYLAAGYTGPRNTMTVYSIEADMISTLDPLPDPLLIFQARAYYGNVWSKKRSSILFFGGYDTTLETPLAGNVVTEYVPATKVWQTLVTSGPAPPMRADHCMASNENGTQMVVFGGRRSDDVLFANDIYIFDTTTQIWRTGIPGLARAYTICTIAGNLFLAWGGVGADFRQVGPEVLIYDLDMNVWITTYTPPSSYRSITQPSTEPSPTPPSGNNDASDSGTKSSSLRAGAIAGGVVGGLAIIIVIVRLITRKGRGDRRGAVLINTREEDDDPDHKPPASAYPEESTRADEELRNLRAQIQNQQEELDLHRRLLLLQQDQQQFHQQMQQQQTAFHQPAYPYQPSPIYGAGLSTSSPYAHPSNAYASDYNPPIVGTSTAGMYSTPSSPTEQVYQAHPYQLVPSPTPSCAVVAASTTSTSRTPSRANSTSIQAESAQGSGNSSQRPLEQRGHPQEGARERRQP
ncbi:hypothetical protein BC939DRAFT_72862 [Gamsiella multidivaricata]|uniref:uncharacterized protein n=1 Tax=Gamsiella multidivaricata TaxID=101098 RepID=UPI00221EABC1|nr:uncharacterized protein BC939DRAFT_72862 [Gamsiella multidivaricata]KAI7815975.1 hypothetical protein BC939DRAFT_72862 [Gamsiella multidivaricata]